MGRNESRFSGIVVTDDFVSAGGEEGTLIGSVVNFFGRVGRDSSDLGGFSTIPSCSGVSSIRPTIVGCFAFLGNMGKLSTLTPTIP